MEEKKKAAKTMTHDPESSEEEDYDYGAECEEVLLMG